MSDVIVLAREKNKIDNIVIESDICRYLIYLAQKMDLLFEPP
jgi:hypothetical protein